MRLFKNSYIKTGQELEDAIRKQMLTATSVKYEVSRAKIVYDMVVEMNKSLISFRNSLVTLWTVILGYVGYRVFSELDLSLLLHSIGL